MVKERPNVVILMARCSRNQRSFGIRVEEKKSGHWVADWAFAIEETSAEREGYDQSEIRGAFNFANTYPGCPHCQAPSVFQCVCGEVACWDGESLTVTCPWCGTVIELREQIEALKVTSDR
jgi:hypothetical protein